MRRRLSSPVADLTNNPNYGYAGAITAALFLNRFVEKAKSWVHLDIAGWTDRPRPGRKLGGEANARARALCAAERALWRDRRTTPARPDLAAAHLKGKVEAATLSTGTRQQVVRGRTTLHADPDHHACARKRIAVRRNLHRL